MSKQRSFWDFEDRLAEISAKGDPLGALSTVVDFERFRPILEKAAIKEGKPAGDIWPDAPAKAAQKDTDTRWMVKHKKAKVGPDGRKRVDIAIPIYGYKSHISIGSMHGIIRRQIVTDAAAYDGDRLREGLIDRCNTCGDVWAGTLPLGGERGIAQGERTEQPHSPQEAARASDEQADRESQRAQIESPGEGRARLRPPGRPGWG